MLSTLPEPDDLTCLLVVTSCYKLLPACSNNLVQAARRCCQQLVNTLVTACWRFSVCIHTKGAALYITRARILPCCRECDSLQCEGRSMFQALHNPPHFQQIQGKRECRLENCSLEIELKISSLVTFLWQYKDCKNQRSVFAKIAATCIKLLGNLQQTCHHQAGATDADAT